MIRTPPQHNTEHPAGQIVAPVGEEYKPESRKGLYLRDVIKRIQGEEASKPQYAEKDPPPIPDSIVGLEALVRALEQACFYVEHETRLLGTQPVLRTSVIRKIIKENT